MNAPTTISNGVETIDVAKLLAERDSLQKLLATMKASAQRKISFKVTAPKTDPKTGGVTGSSGAISLYGLGRFPITLYASQWEALISAVPDLQAFMATNRALLSTKD